MGQSERRFFMTTLPEDELKALQRDVERSLGRCMLQLQRYERLLKALVAHLEIAGPPQDLEAVRAARVEDVARKTLGTLVKEFLGSGLVNGLDGPAPEAQDDRREGAAFFRFQMQIGMREEDFAQTATELKDLVQLRNTLVHHFIDLHDLWSVAGCRDAQATLDEASDRISQCYGHLRDWAAEIDQTRQAAAKALQSDAYQNYFIRGISPDGTVDWPVSSLVSGFREAARALAGAEGKWVSVAEAAMWIAEKNPDRTPQLYGCKTWQQALHDSRLFDLRNDRKEGGRGRCFREKANPKSQDMPERTWELDGDGALILPQ